EDGSRNGPHVFKISGMYQLPYEITASANFNEHSNFPFNPGIVGPTRANGLSTATMLVGPVNALRYPAVKTLDLNFDKTIRVGGGRRIVLNAALFNIMNDNTTLALQNSSNTQVTNVVNVVRQNISTANFIN